MSSNSSIDFFSGPSFSGTTRPSRPPPPTPPPTAPAQDNADLWACAGRAPSTAPSWTPSPSGGFWARRGNPNPPTIAVMPIDLKGPAELVKLIIEQEREYDDVARNVDKDRQTYMTRAVPYMVVNEFTHKKMAEKAKRTLENAALMYDQLDTTRYQRERMEALAATTKANKLLLDRAWISINAKYVDDLLEYSRIVTREHAKRPLEIDEDLRTKIAKLEERCRTNVTMTQSSNDVTMTHPDTVTLE